MADPKNEVPPRVVRPRPTAKAEAKDAPEAVEKKVVEQVVSEGGATPQKKSLGSKFKELFAGADAKGAVSYVVTEVLIPAARNMILEGVTKGVERIVYPDANPPGRRIYGPTTTSRVSYSPGGYRPPETRPPTGRTIRSSTSPRPNTDYVISSRAEAELVVERMGDLLEVYEVVTVADLHDLIGIPAVHTDNKFGWDNLRGVDVRPVRDGYLITLGPPDPIR